MWRFPLQCKIELRAIRALQYVPVPYGAEQQPQHSFIFSCIYYEIVSGSTRFRPSTSSTPQLCILPASRPRDVFICGSRRGRLSPSAINSSHRRGPGSGSMTATMTTVLVPKGGDNCASMMFYRVSFTAPWTFIQG